MNISHKFRIVLVAAMLQVPFLGNAEDFLVFDIGGVLTKVDRLPIALYAAWDIIRYPFLAWKNPANLKKELFEALTEIGGSQKPEPGSSAASYEGTAHPELLCKFKRGEISGKQLMATVAKALDDPNYNGILKHPIEKTVIKKILAIMVDPDLLAGYTYPVENTKQLLHDCAQNKNVTFMILSNHDGELFDKLWEKPEFKEVFQYFDKKNVFVSGKTGRLKPYASTYQNLKNSIKDFNPEKDRLFFFDDEQANVDAAAQQGFNAFYYAKECYAKIRDSLVSHGVIKK